MIAQFLSAIFTTGKFSSEVRHSISGVGGAAVVLSILTAEQAATLTQILVEILTSQQFYLGLGAFVISSITSRVSDKQKAK